MTAPATNPLSYNLYVQQIGIMAVVQTQEVSGVWQFVDPASQGIVAQMLNYAELRIQRDLDMLAAQSSNDYTLTAGSYVFNLPVNDFIIVQRVSLVQLTSVSVGFSPQVLVVGATPVPPTQSATVSVTPLLQVSQEFIQNVYGGLANAGVPKYYAMIGDNFGNGGDVNNNIAFGPTPSYPFTIRVHGLIRTPSLYTYATAGAADTTYTYISQFYPDMLIMASMIYISAFQRNFSATSSDVEMSMSYEKQYQELRLGAISEENRKKSQGSGWSSYSTPTAATPTR